MGEARDAKSKRVFGLDLAKAVAMLLVVFIHYTFYVPLYPNTLAGNVVSVLTVCGVPLFLMVNGMLLFSKRLDLRSHYMRTLRIALVMLAWKVVSALVMWPLSGVSPVSGGLRALAGYLLCGDLPGVSLGHFWFMYALMYFLAGGLFPILVGSCPSDEDGVPAKKNGAPATRPPLPLPALAFVVAWACLCCFQRYQAASQGVAFCVNNGYQDPLTLVMTLAAFSLLLRASRPADPIVGVVESVGANTLGIYYVRMFALTACANLLCPLCSGLPLAANLLLVIACYAVCHAVVLLMRRIPLMGVLFGA